ncbi:cyclic nucleotide-binding domain-containing protein [Butyrivibrio proteoclasticus]|uniref:cyclic nucleotide-binding domain-containing protein n=1 Tax=Butyrivibrio proteoclasticus TaxID=43305 RepID=UPI00047E596F|nr:cyclic nucleotide-binding domain-containing protein [Butyrivibrio proteoclasticus]
MLTKVPEGTIILRENEVNMDMYKIVDGHVEVYSGYGTDSEAILSVLGKGSYFGEIGLLAQKPAIYTVIAYDDVLLMRITMDDIDEYIKANYHDIFHIMQHMAETMYNLKYSMDMVIGDFELRDKVYEKKEYKAYFSKMFAKYNVTSSPITSPKRNVTYKE